MNFPASTKARWTPAVRSKLPSVEMDSTLSVVLKITSSMYGRRIWMLANCLLLVEIAMNSMRVSPVSPCSDLRTAVVMLLSLLSPFCSSHYSSVCSSPWHCCRWRDKGSRRNDCCSRLSRLHQDLCQWRETLLTLYIDYGKRVMCYFREY